MDNNEDQQKKIAALQRIIANQSGKYSRSVRDKASEDLKDIAGDVVATVPNPTEDPISGSPLGGAPAPIANLVPSAMNFGNHLISGMGQMAAHPIDTIQGIPGAMFDHYKNRYFTPEEGQPWYSDAVNTFKKDPFGAAMDVSIAGTGLKMMNKGGAVGQIGGALERLDPINLAGGAMERSFGEVRNRWGDSPEDVMGGGPGAYGGPAGSQKRDSAEYLNTVGAALDQGFPPTMAGEGRAKAAIAEAGERIEQAIRQADSDGGRVSRESVVRELTRLRNERASGVEQPYANVVDKFIDDIMGSGSPIMTYRELQDLKTRAADKVNYESNANTVSPRTEGLTDVASEMRGRLRGDQSISGAFDEYGQAVRVEDLVRRGNQNRILSSGGGATDGILANAVNAVPAMLTGLDKYSRSQQRRVGRDGSIMEQVGAYTAPTMYTPLRQSAWMAEQERAQAGEPTRWSIGILQPEG